MTNIYNRNHQWIEIHGNLIFCEIPPCSIQELSSELEIIASITSMPILEPLSASRVEKVCQLGLACLDVAITIATGNFSIAGAAGK